MIRFDKQMLVFTPSTTTTTTTTTTTIDIDISPASTAPCKPTQPQPPTAHSAALAGGRSSWRGRRRAQQAVGRRRIRTAPATVTVRGWTNWGGIGCEGVAAPHQRMHDHTLYKHHSRRCNKPACNSHAPNTARTPHPDGHCNCRRGQTARAELALAVVAPAIAAGSRIRVPHAAIVCSRAAPSDCGTERHMLPLATAHVCTVPAKMAALLMFGDGRRGCGETIPPLAL